LSIYALKDKELTPMAIVLIALPTKNGKVQMELYVGLIIVKLATVSRLMVLVTFNPQPALLNVLISQNCLQMVIVRSQTALNSREH
jgi:hypothetical protein